MRTTSTANLPPRASDALPAPAPELAIAVPVYNEHLACYMDVDLSTDLSFSDAQCGFKAIRAETAGDLLPLVQDQEWFFDTELLVLAQRRGLRIHEVPVDWVEDSDSRVDVLATALADLRGIARLLSHRPAKPLTLLSPRPPVLAR